MMYQLSRPALNSARKKTSEHWLQVHVRAALSFPYRGGTSTSIRRDSSEIRLCCVFDCITFVIFKYCEEKFTVLLPCAVTPRKFVFSASGSFFIPFFLQN